jgi:hypothetical protein
LDVDTRIWESEERGEGLEKRKGVKCEIDSDD